MRGFIIIGFLCLFCLPSRAQNVTVINHFEGDSMGLSPEDYVLRSVTEHTYVVNQFARVDNSPATRVREMIDYSIRSYTETVFSVSGGKVIVRKSPPVIISDLNAIVRNAIWLFDYDFFKDFTGFSSRLESLAGYLAAKNGKSVDFSSTGENTGSDKISFFAFQKEVLDFKQEASKEVEDFLRPRLKRSEMEEEVHSRVIQMPFDPEKEDLAYQYIPPLDVELTPDMESEKELEEIKLNELAIESAKQNKSGSKKPLEDGDVGNRIVELLEENNRILAQHNSRFELMQAQINEIRENRDNPVKEEIAELRAMVNALMKGEVYTATDGSSTRKMDAKPVEVRFDKNSWEISWHDQVKLNEVKANLLKNKAYRIMITGFADKSGNPEYNIRISRLRAEAVQKFLLKAGISRERLVINYYGDNQSLTENPDDRKVEIEWLLDTSLSEAPH